MLDSGEPAQKGFFPSTRWSLILRARDGGDETVGMALESLCRIYRAPVYTYLRSRGHSAHDAEDLTQGFFADLLSRAFLSKVGPENGRFRSFMLRSLQNYLAKDHRKANAQKRGGGISIEDFSKIEEQYAASSDGCQTPDVLFDRNWVVALLDAVLASLEDQYVREGKGELYAAVRGRVLDTSVSESYKDLSEKLQMSESALKVAVHRFRKQYRKALRDAVAETVAEGSDVDKELSYLMGVFRT